MREEVLVEDMTAAGLLLRSLDGVGKPRHGADVYDGGVQVRKRSFGVCGRRGGADWLI
jgi:hypothetical protein